jgi:uncharacterized membrane protein (UPF0127 family)|tara:strand:+ start:275 stop:712 length:438 start_codon:yes stop_codon:yes gene_type:complete
MKIRESRLRKLIRESISLSRYLPSVELTVNGIPLQVELANDEQSRNQGLMFRESLPDDSGMLFVFPDLDQRSFWMKDTYIPLSIAYLNEKGEILNIEDMHPFNLSGVKSKGPAMCALEMNRGWFHENNIFPGDIIYGIPAGRLGK